MQARAYLPSTFFFAVVAVLMANTALATEEAAEIEALEHGGGNLKKQTAPMRDASIQRPILSEKNPTYSTKNISQKKQLGGWNEYPVGGNGGLGSGSGGFPLHSFGKGPPAAHPK